MKKAGIIMLVLLCVVMLAGIARRHYKIKGAEKQIGWLKTDVSILRSKIRRDSLAITRLENNQGIIISDFYEE